MAKLDETPMFAVMNDASGTRKFLPMRFADESGTQGPEVCAFFLSPVEAGTALQQAAKVVGSSMKLVIGCMPLGKAFALAVGWAQAKGSAPFVLRSTAPVMKQVCAFGCGGTEHGTRGTWSCNDDVPHRCMHTPRAEWLAISRSRARKHLLSRKDLTKMHTSKNISAVLICHLRTQE